MGETIEKLLAEVLPNAVHLKKDKKWFDIVQDKRGIEVKTFKAKPPLRTGSSVSNVLKRVSKVQIREQGKLRDPRTVGNEVIEYLNDTIKKHAEKKHIPDRHIVAILFRTSDGQHFAYWEQPLSFGRGEDYDWTWNPNETLTGELNQEAIFQWYSKNQKQLFYLWKVPASADFFEVTPVRTVTFTQSEYENEQKSWYGHGYDNGSGGKPRRM